ncbi:hypothetical protein BCV23_08840 [Vibrio lentus]|uniref:Uncharacterized protein n=1 Tax=Vibrio lentus TaxID=136468 RepID=A0AA44VSU1_9VIBR|nr:hypothetical protein BCV23_08840 [Vibrio lentus]PMF81969.1 hypothetical protein BCV10_00030 [Vibrio lentus]
MLRAYTLYRKKNKAVGSVSEGMTVLLSFADIMIISSSNDPGTIKLGLTILPIFSRVICFLWTISKP